MTSGVGTSTQTTNSLGQFNIPNTGGWQIYTFTPLVDSNGNLVTITNSGAVSTLRLIQNAGGYNLNFLMLFPAAATGPKLTFSRTATDITISWAPTGGRLEASPVLGASANWQPIGATNPAVIPFTGAAQYFRVISP